MTYTIRGTPTCNVLPSCFYVIFSLFNALGIYEINHFSRQINCKTLGGYLHYLIILYVLYSCIPFIGNHRHVSYTEI